ncbi:hypothetical protein Glove_87g15 [Diversispora epigaea]|uniref:BTB domain-containing protein n=1 Tax=Diversispora epigaea TaxID=1348612 RepID=A0A397JCY9_9GLOM|nr:hypothetical protein Glove_87g15 [Diversispora epigaea]
MLSLLPSSTAANSNRDEQQQQQNFYELHILCRTSYSESHYVKIFLARRIKIVSIFIMNERFELVECNLGIIKEYNVVTEVDKEENMKSFTHILLSYIIVRLTVQIFEIILKYFYGGIVNIENTDTKTVYDLMVNANELELKEQSRKLESYLFESKSSWLRTHFPFFIIQSLIIMNLKIRKNDPKKILSIENNSVNSDGALCYLNDRNIGNL